MTLLPFDVTLPSGAPRGRTIKFTPERMEQIKNLVERGIGREEIAQIIGVTVGSLQVTCSRAGISLRRPRDDSDMMARPTAKTTDGNGRRTGLPAMPEVKVSPTMSASQAKATLILRLETTGSSRESQVSLPLDLIGELAVVAEFRGVRLADLIAEALAEAIHRMEVAKDAPLTQG
jgi:hypothetical protein